MFLLGLFLRAPPLHNPSPAVCLELFSTFYRFPKLCSLLLSSGVGQPIPLLFTILSNRNKQGWCCRHTQRCCCMQWSQSCHLLQAAGVPPTFRSRSPRGYDHLELGTDRSLCEDGTRHLLLPIRCRPVNVFFSKLLVCKLLMITFITPPLLYVMVFKGETKKIKRCPATPHPDSTIPVLPVYCVTVFVKTTKHKTNSYRHT